MKKQIEPLIHPGELLVHEFMVPRLAVELDIDVDVLEEIVSGERGLDEKIAAKLAKWSGTSLEFWLNLEWHYNQEKDKLP